jgi:hypothetical protein
VHCYLGHCEETDFGRLEVPFGCFHSAGSNGVVWD